MRRLLYGMPMALFIGLIAFFGYGLTRDPSRIPSMLIDRALPRFALPGLDASTPGFDATSFGDGRVLGEPKLLNVFASWCAACPQEHPMLKRIAAEGVPIFGLDWKDQPDAAKAWLAQLGNPYRRVGSDPTARTGIDLGVTGVPETFVIDGHGRVRYKQVGPITADDWDHTLRPMLERLKAAA